MRCLLALPLLLFLLPTTCTAHAWKRFNLTVPSLQRFLDPGDHPRLLYHKAWHGSHKSIVACIPSKNGITTARSVFYQLKHPQGVSPRNLYDNRLFTWADKLPPAEVQGLLEADSVLRLAVLRNPFERMASAYVNKVVEPREFDYVLKYVQSRCDLSESKLTFESFVRCVTRQNPMLVDRHFMPQVYWCGLHRARYDHLLTTHGLGQQLMDVMERHNYTVFGVPRLNRARGGGKRKKDWRALYTPELRALVEDYYAIDFQFLAAAFNKSSVAEFWDSGL